MSRKRFYGENIVYADAILGSLARNVANYDFRINKNMFMFEFMGI